MRAAGIEFVADGVNDVHRRWEKIGVQEIAGRERVGSSTWQWMAPAEVLARLGEPSPPARKKLSQMS